jgi:GntR family transcriptional regulator, sialic acid-inducible nan operon repressor
VKSRRLGKRSDEVIAGIEAMVASGEVPVGGELPSERTLMRRFNVGRPSIREAFYALEQRGRIRISNGVRARVVEPSADALVQLVTSGVLQMLRRPEAQDHLNDARMLFEVALARHAAEHATRADVTRMQQLLETNRLAVGRPPLFARTDADFHHALALVPGNPIFPALQRGLVEWLTEQRNVTFEMPEADEIAYQDHAALLDAIVDRDPDRAEQVMRQHLTFVREVYRAVLQASRDVLRDVTRSVARKVIDQRDTQPSSRQGSPLPRSLERQRK